MFLIEFKREGGQPTAMQTREAARINLMGTPVFLATTHPLSTRPLNRLMLAQDTGSAIKGAVRADFFWGFGEQAGRSRAADDKTKTDDGVQYAEGTTAEAIALDKRIRKHAADHKLSYAEAAEAVAAGQA